MSPSQPWLFPFLWALAPIMLNAAQSSPASAAGAAGALPASAASWGAACASPGPKAAGTW